MTLKNLTKSDIQINNHVISIFENSHIVFGFTHRKTQLGEVISFLKGENYFQLTQIHSSTIFTSRQIQQDSKGDGFILTEKEKIGVIKTADCVPLFFWNRQYSIGGILHIGWRGLSQGIESRLFAFLKDFGIAPSDMVFYFGPSIQKECYTVSEDLYQQFITKPYGKKIFQKNNTGDYQMDIKKGIRLSLKSLGIDDVNIIDSRICTFCQNRSFPSYRYNRGTKERIFNFFMIKNSI